MKANQKQYERINRLMIAPLEKLYGKKYDDDISRAMIEDLYDFTDTVLQNALVDIRRAETYQPKIATIISACRKVQKDLPSNTDGAQSYYNELLARNHRANERTQKYLSEYELSPLMSQSKAEGWQRKLDEYVTMAAGYQAQLIENVPNKGYSNAIYRWLGHDADRVAEERGRFQRDSAIQAAQGFIKVDVPNGAITHWKALTPRQLEQLGERS